MLTERKEEILAANKVDMDLAANAGKVVPLNSSIGELCSGSLLFGLEKIRQVSEP